jgi:hypothetical protein
LNLFNFFRTYYELLPANSPISSAKLSGEKGILFI